MYNVNFDISGQVAVITGAGGVICGTMAREMAKKGVKVALLDLFDPNAQEDATLYDLIRGTLILDMSGYPETLKRFLLGLLLEMLYAQMQNRERSLGRELQKMVLI